MSTNNHKSLLLISQVSDKNNAQSSEKLCSYICYLKASTRKQLMSPSYDIMQLSAELNTQLVVVSFTHKPRHHKNN